MDEKMKISSTRLSSLCERVIDIQSSKDSYRFPRSILHQISQTNFGVVDWWNITTTDPHDDEVNISNKSNLCSRSFLLDPNDPTSSNT